MMISIIKRLITLIFILGCFGLFWMGYDTQSQKTSTPENDYEQIFNQKITKLFNILIGPNQYYVNTTVFLRHKEERSLRYVRTPKSILYEKETVQNSSESKSSEAPVLEFKSEKENLPGIKNVIQSTKKYEVTQKIQTEKLSLEEKNNSHKEIIEEIYYDENKFETIKPNFGLEKIKILIMVNQDTMQEKGLTLDMLRRRINQIIPLKEDRGDLLIIEQKMIDFTPPYLKMVETLFSDSILNKNMQYAGAFILIGLIIFGLIKAILFIRSIQKARKKEMLLEQELTQNQIEPPVISLNQQVIKTIETEPTQTQEIVEYWMEQHYAKK